jgi:hypothetical protein
MGIRSNGHMMMLEKNSDQMQTSWKMGEQSGVGKGVGTVVAVAPSRSIRPGRVRVGSSHNDPAMSPTRRFVL